MFKPPRPFWTWREPTTDPEKIRLGFRRLYWTFGLRAFAGVLVFVAVYFVPWPSKWWSVPLVLVGAWLVLANLFALEALSRAHHLYTHGPEDDTALAMQERGERLLHYTGFLLLFATMLAIPLFGRVVENIIEEIRWVMLSAALGVLAASLVLWWARQRFPLYYRNNEKRAASVLGLFFGTVGLCVLVPARIDRESAADRSAVRRYALEDTGSNIKTGSKFLHLYHPGQAEHTFRIQVRSKELEAAMGRDSVDLLVGTGDLGFTHVLEVVE